MTRAPRSLPPLSASQLAALLDELAAQARLGIPWAEAVDVSERRWKPQGLEPLTDQLRRGRDVQEVLAEIAGKYGRQVAAVAEAGAAAGRPAEALAGLAALIRRRLEYRRRLAMALVYPVTISAIAGVLLAAGLVWISVGEPMAADAVSTVRLSRGGGALPGGERWWWTTPAGIALAAIIVWLLRRQLSRWVPSRLRALRWARLAWFAELVALAIEQGMPIGEAVRIAAEASGDRGLRRAAEQWTAAELQGQRQFPLEPSPLEPVGVRSADSRDAPGLLLWTLRNGASSPLGFPEALRRLAGVYWYRSEQAATWATIVLPAVLLVSVAGTLAIAFIVIVLGPIYRTFV
ncbi:type II secretion system F family protein [Candidatus Laterigemmans baculatus]|uniref:type II secretion system F family protein n=1 Tax=Candidatus Laterigemmans baculatus TaxID=2770505 RepID=UPI0013DA8604|nr:type II secretion system F family protein [Candidatus Laterigemmans baculatus]